MKKLNPMQIEDFIAIKENFNTINHFNLDPEEKYKISFNPKGVTDYLCSFQKVLLSLEENKELKKLDPPEILNNFCLRKENSMWLENFTMSEENCIFIPVSSLLNYLSKFQDFLELAQ